MVRTSMVLALALVLAPLCSSATNGIVMHHTFSPLLNVGQVEQRGFPVWFNETAVGLGSGDGWHTDRFAANTCIWAIILLLGGSLLNIALGRTQSRQP